MNAALIVSTASLPNGFLSVAYSQTLTGSGGSAASYAWSLNGGSLPAGLSLSAAGVISGTPTGMGTSNFVVKLTDSASNSATQSLAITINAALAVSTSSLPNAFLTVLYSQTLTATGGSGAGYTWSLNSGTLPAGLTLSAAGAISGTAVTTGTSNFVVKVTDSASNTATQSLNIVVNPALAVSTASLPNGYLTVAYSQTLTAAGGSGAGYTWSLNSGSLPAGFTLSGAGLISGTPTATGTSNFAARVTDSASNTATQSLSILVDAALSVSTASLPDGFLTVACSNAHRRWRLGHRVRVESQQRQPSCRPHALQRRSHLGHTSRCRHQQLRH